MLRGSGSGRPPARETRMKMEMEMEVDNRAGESERMTEHREPPITFDPYEPTEPTTPIKSPTRLPLSASSSSNPLLSNLQHQRQYSAPDLSFLPADTQSRSRSPPKQGHVRHQSQGMPLTGDGRAGRRSDNSPGRFGGWLSSAPTSTDGSPDTTPRSRRSTAANEPTPKSATPSRLGFFASSMSALTTRLTTPANAATTSSSLREVDDELCNLDVEAALYPGPQSPADRDTFSPAAYKNLQANAAGLLHKMQDAYRQRTAALREAQAEHEAQAEEMEETELRTRNFRAQLESMAARAAEQERAMQRLVGELQAEKEARRREEQERALAARGAPPLTITEDLCVTEDEAEERRRRRKSAGTDLSSSGTDTDGESAESESIFSRSRSPTAATSVTVATTADGEGAEPASGGRTAGSHHPSASAGVTTPTSKLAPKSRAATPSQQQPLTAFQKLVRGISGEAGAGAGADGCANCRGQDSSVAWDTVSLLRDENRSLKHRVAQLEVVVEGALDVVNGIGMA
ncbi:hypothetical protein GGR52DRAFT_530760 [Hypoxylon sp. FL1284]|nr:hypothetical protein GGR52DRAFT_530760 [Hypoxylon sp. FL1284]